MEEDEIGNLTDEEPNELQIGNLTLEQPNESIKEEQEVEMEQVKIIDVPTSIFVTAPQNQSNSCFLDSLLMALFFIDNVFIDYCFLNKILHIEVIATKMIFGSDSEQDLQKRKDIQKLLIEFVESIRQKTNNSNTSSTIIVYRLRLCLADCKFQCLKNTTIQQDAMEYLYSMLEILQLHENFNEIKTQVFGTNDLLNANPDPIVCTTTRIEKTSPVYHVVTWHENDDLSFLLQSKIDSGILKDGYYSSGKMFQRQITTTNYIPNNNSFFIIHIDRTLKNPNLINQTPIKLEEFIFIEKKKFEICSIVLHIGSININSGHYVCLVKNKTKKWMLYDDTKQQEHFDTFSQAIIQTQVQKRCVLILLAQ